MLCAHLFQRSRYMGKGITDERALKKNSALPPVSTVVNLFKAHGSLEQGSARLRILRLQEALQ